MILRYPRGRHDLHIKRNYKVLEIGPGHNPSLRSDVLVEKFIDSNFHRCGDVSIYAHQKLVNASGENLPFADKEFDYVICNQVLEHSDNPEKFLKEMTRVAKRGYLEIPSLLGEFLFPKESHVQVMLAIDNKLVICNKDRVPGNFEQNYGELFLNYLPFQSLPFKFLYYSEANMMNIHLEWEDDIDFIVNPESDEYTAFFTKKWNRAMVEKLFPPRSATKELCRMISTAWYVLKDKWMLRRMRGEKRLTLDQYIAQNNSLE